MKEEEPRFKIRVRRPTCMVCEKKIALKPNGIRSLVPAMCAGCGLEDVAHYSMCAYKIKQTVVCAECRRNEDG